MGVSYGTRGRLGELRLTHHRELKRRREKGLVSKSRRNTHGDEKASVWQTVVAGPSLTMGHREHFDQRGPARCFLVYHT